MANHPYRGGPVLVVYTRHPHTGQLERHSIRGMTKEAHIEHYDIGSATDTERLVGWPEHSVEWHGNTGYGLGGEKTCA